MLRRHASAPGLAYEVEREQSLRAGALRGTLEVAGQQGGGGTLAQMGAEQLAARLRPASPRGLAPRATRVATHRALIAAATGVAAVLLLYSRSNAAPDGWRAIANPVDAWRGTLLEPIALRNAPHAVLRGERLVLQVSAAGRRSITVSQRATGSAWHTSRHDVHEGVASVPVGPVDAALTLFASDGRTTSDTASIAVAERPFLGDVSVRAEFPAYLDRRAEAVPLGEPVRLPRGTVLGIAGQSSTELRSVTLAHEADSLSLATDGRRFAGRIAVQGNLRYTWSAVGATGPIPDVPQPLNVEMVPDSAPRIEILSPAGDTIVSAADTVTLSILATDDHGLADVSLRVWRVRADGRGEAERVLPVVAEATAQWAGAASVALPAFQLGAGDALHVVATASDASPWAQSGASEELVLQVPGLRSQREHVVAAADSAAQRAAAAAEAQKQLQQRTEEAARRRDRTDAQGADGARSGESSPMSFESAETAQQLAKEQRALAQRMEELREAARDLEKQFKQTGALDSALASRLQEAQKLLSDALTPELMAQLQKLEESARDLSQPQTRQALADLAAQQNRLREQLEKSVEMLKRAALEGAMQSMKQEATEIAKREHELADSLSSARTEPQQQSAKQESRALNERSKGLAEDLAALQERLRRENAEVGAQKMAQARSDVRESQEAMQKVSGATASQPRSQPTPSDSSQASRQNQSGQQQAGQQRQAGQQQKAGQQQTGQQNQAGQQQKAGQQQAGRQNQAGQQQKSGQQQSGQQQSGQQNQSGQQPANAQRDANAARDAAKSMEQAAEQLSQARAQQIDEWKKELTSELDQSVQEMLQLSREQESLEQQARQGAEKGELQPRQSALAQGAQQAGRRLNEAGRKSSLLSERTQGAVADAQRKVEQAAKELAQAKTSQQAAGAMRDASEALNQAAASLVRDRERAQSSESASGFPEMLKRMQELAQQQGSLNAQTQGLLPRAGQSLSQQGREAARQIGERQREMAARLQETGENDRTGRTDDLAREAKQLAQALEAGSIDQNVIDRQQRLFRRMLDAGRTLEQEEREDQGKRESTPWTGTEVFTPSSTNASGKAATKFQPPTWNELRGLTPEERRLVLEYFKRINGEKP
ncbi:MAG TPA: hypothetical protein VFG84_05530 [Gemmatimonadaceae bacterium]|nr:hypothetical protein [Gemmatimonadaceae bacterium]